MNEPYRLNELLNEQRRLVHALFAHSQGALPDLPEADIDRASNRLRVVNRLVALRLARWEADIQRRELEPEPGSLADFGIPDLGLWDSPDYRDDASDDSE